MGNTRMNELRKLSAVVLATAALAGCRTTQGAQRSESVEPNKPVAAVAQTPPVPAEVQPAPAPSVTTQTDAQQPAREAVKESPTAALFAEAVAAFDAGKYDEATAGFKRVLEKDPGDVNAQYDLGVIAERQHDLPRAQAAYEAAHKLDPHHAPTLLNLAKVYRMQDRLAQAISLYEEALKAPGKEYDAALLNSLTTAYRLAKDYTKAEEAARKVLARNPEDAEAYKNLALIYYDQGNYRLAEFISGNARKLNEKDPGIHNNLGLIYLKMNDRPRALAAFRKAVALDDSFVPGHLNIGAMALAHRDYEGAERSFAKVIELDPTSYEGLLYYAYALDGEKARNPKKGLDAGAAYEKVLALRSDDAEAVCGAGWAYGADRSGWDKAVPFLERCKGLSVPEDQQKIDSKLKTIAAMKSAAPMGAEGAAPKPAAQPAPGGESIIDKAAAEDAQQNGAPPDQAGGAAAPQASKLETSPAEAAPAAPANEERPGT